CRLSGGGRHYPSRCWRIAEDLGDEILARTRAITTLRRRRVTASCVVRRAGERTGARCRLTRWRYFSASLGHLHQVSCVLEAKDPASSELTNRLDQGRYQLSRSSLQGR